MIRQVATLLTSKRDRSSRRVAAVSAACLAALLLAGIGCGGRPPAGNTTPSPTLSGWQVEAQRLLDKYALQATGEPAQIWHRRLRFRPVDMGFVLYADASQRIGLDLRAHAGQKAFAFSIPVRRETPDGPLSAVFIVRRDTVIGACVLYNATPGVMALADRPQR
jgi:hypothetical protein